MRTASVLGMVSIILGCGGGDSGGIDEILYSSVGTWVGTAASGEWLEMTIFTEATGCCYRLASGQGRTAGTSGDTLTVTFFGSNASTGLLFNLRNAGDSSLGQFTGQFSGATNIVGVMVGPEAFGQPPAGPFHGDSVAITLRKE